MDKNNHTHNFTHYLKQQQTKFAHPANTPANARNNKMHKSKQATHREPLDCSGSSFGLFMGLLSMVTLVIALILYFALVNQQDYHMVAILVNNVSGKTLYPDFRFFLLCKTF